MAYHRVHARVPAMERRRSEEEEEVGAGLRVVVLIVVVRGAACGLGHGAGVWRIGSTSGGSRSAGRASASRTLPPTQMATSRKAKMKMKMKMKMKTDGVTSTWRGRAMDTTQGTGVRWEG